MIILRLVALAVVAWAAWAVVVELDHRFVSRGLTLDAEPLNAARDLHVEGFAEDAELLARFTADTASGAGERHAAQRLLDDIAAGDTFSDRVARFTHGALTGEPRDLAGFLGSLSLDLFVVGDIRDIAVQGYRETTSGDGDRLILALSAIGLGASLAPHVHFAPALMKAFRRVGAFSERFLKVLTRSARGGDLGKLTRVAGDFGRTARRLGPAPLARVMKHVDEPADLARLSRAAGHDAAAAYSLTHLTSGRALKVFDRAGSNVSKLARAVRRTGRGAKIFAKAVESIPDRALLGLGLLLVVMLLLGLRPLLRSPRRRHGAPRRRGGAIPTLTDAVRT